MKDTNEMEILFDSRSENEGFARVAVAAFMTQLNPTVEEVSDVKTAVSEAVTNAIIHGYDNQICKVSIRCSVRGKELMVEVRDTGKGIENIKQAMTPMYTSKPELERSGMGFSFMEAFMDNVHVISEPGEGTRVIIEKEHWERKGDMDHTIALIEKSHNGDKEAREQLVEENIGLIWCVVKRFYGRGIEAEDLFQIGSIGLIKQSTN